MKRFQNQVIFVSGGTSGIGLEAAIEFARQGAANVIVCGRTLAKWRKAQKHIESTSASAEQVIEYWPCDVRIEHQVSSVIQRLYAKFGRLDVCVNNAGVQPVNNGDITNWHFESYMASDGSIIFRPSATGSMSSGSENVRFYIL